MTSAPQTLSLPTTLEIFVLSRAPHPTPKKNSGSGGPWLAPCSHSDPEGKAHLPSVSHQASWLPGLCFLMGWGLNGGEEYIWTHSSESQPSGPPANSDWLRSKQVAQAWPIRSLCQDLGALWE